MIYDAVKKLPFSEINVFLSAKVAQAPLMPSSKAYVYIMCYSLYMRKALEIVCGKITLRKSITFSFLFTRSLTLAFSFDFLFFLLCFSFSSSRTRFSFSFSLTTALFSIYINMYVLVCNVCTS